MNSENEQTVAVSMMLLPPSPGKCQCCAVEHKKHEPHNQQSVYWQFWFNMKFGRSPTWADAIAHSPEPLYSYWKNRLIEISEYDFPDTDCPIACVTADNVPMQPCPYEITFHSFKPELVNDEHGPFVFVIDGQGYKLTLPHVETNQRIFGPTYAFAAALQKYNAWLKSEGSANA